MKKFIYIVLGILGVILIIGMIGSWQFGKWKEKLPQSAFSKIESIEQLKKSYSSQKNTKDYKEFTSPDGKLKMQYRSDWLEIKDGNQQKFLPETGKYGLKHLFLALKPEIGKFVQLTISEGNFDTQKTPEEIIEEMKESNLKQGWSMELIKPEVKTTEVIFEAKYKKVDRYNLHSKEKILLLEEKEGKRKVYLIAFVTFDKNWQEFEKEAEEIISSVQFVE